MTVFEGLLVELVIRCCFWLRTFLNFVSLVRAGIGVEPCRLAVWNFGDYEELAMSDSHIQ